MGRQFISHGKLGKSGPVLKSNGNRNSVVGALMNSEEKAKIEPQTPDKQELSHNSVLRIKQWELIYRVQ